MIESQFIALFKCMDWTDSPYGSNAEAASELHRKIWSVNRPETEKGKLELSLSKNKDY